jgi:hypothetical protein
MHIGAISTAGYGQRMATCSGGRIAHTDGTVAGCTNDDDGDCAGIDERHEGDPVVCWRWFGRCDRCGIQS